MNEETMTKEQLIQEITELRQRVDQQEQAEINLRRLEDELRKSQERYRNILESIVEGYYLVDLAGNFTLFNDSLCDMLGYSRDELQGLNNRQYTDAENAKKLYKAFNEVYRTGIPLRGFIWQMVRKDGTTRFGEISVSPIQDEQRQITGFRGIVRDITERRQAEEALQTSEELFRALAENTHDVIMRFDPELRHLYTNPNAVQQCGIPREAFLGRTCREMGFPLDLVTRWEEALRLAFDSRSVQRLEFQLPTGMWIDWICAPELDSAGRVRAVITSARDITELKRAGEALRDSETRLNNIIEGTNVGTWEWNVQTGETVFNERWAEITGTTLAELGPLSIQTWWALMHPEDLKESEKQLTQVFLRERSRYDIEYRLKHRNGDWVWVHNRGKVIDWTEDGKPRLMAGAQTDISERKRMEAERFVMSKLESTGILAGGIAHDFNNLLSIILGNLDLVKLFDQTKEEMTECLDAAMKAGLDARGLTHQLITLAQGGDPFKKLTSLSEVLREQVALTLRGSSVAYSFFIPNDLWPVEVDEGQISQVVRNIVLNAREAMLEGGKVTVAAANLELTQPSNLPLLPGNYLKITISDQGKGIPGDILPKIFDPYFSTKQQGTQKGMGLGLTISRSIMQKHGGTIIVDTEVGQGTTVQVYFPASSQAGLTKTTFQEVLSRKGRILVMDDEEMVRTMFKSILNRLGYEVGLVENGEQALETYQNAKELGHPFDAIILDLTVRGGMGGKETVQALLRIDPTVKAVVCSGYDQDPVMQNWEQYGFKAALTKPYLISDLKEILSKVIGVKTKNESIH